MLRPSTATLQQHFNNCLDRHTAQHGTLLGAWADLITPGRVQSRLRQRWEEDRIGSLLLWHGDHAPTTAISGTLNNTSDPKLGGFTMPTTSTPQQLPRSAHCSAQRWLQRTQYGVWLLVRPLFSSNARFVGCTRGWIQERLSLLTDLLRPGNAQHTTCVCPGRQKQGSIGWLVHSFPHPHASSADVP